MKYKTQNGWTKAKMIEAIQTKMLDHASVSDHGGCSYLASDGNKCAVGVFIPDGHVGAQYEQWVGSLLLEYPDLRALMPLEVAALEKLQNIHDMHAKTTSPFFLNDSSGEDPRPHLIAWIEENVEDRT